MENYDNLFLIDRMRINGVDVKVNILLDKRRAKIYRRDTGKPDTVTLFEKAVKRRKNE